MLCLVAVLANFSVKTAVLNGASTSIKITAPATPTLLASIINRSGKPMRKKHPQGCFLQICLKTTKGNEKMSEQIKRIENDVMRAMELIKKDGIARTCKNGDFTMDYLEKVGTKNEDFLYLRDEIAKPVGEHTSFIAKTFLQFGLFVGFVMVKSAELHAKSEELAESLTGAMKDTERSTFEDVIPQIMSRFGYTREKATAMARETFSSPQVQVQLDSIFAERVEQLKSMGPELSACISANRSTRTFSAEAEPICRLSCSALALKNDDFFEFDKMAPAQISKNEREFLKKLYELSKDVITELITLERFFPEAVIKKIEEYRGDLEYCRNELIKERARFKEESEKAALATKKELEKVNARIEKGFSPKDDIIVAAVAFALTVVFYFLRNEGGFWAVCFAVSGLVWLGGMYGLYDMFIKKSGKKLEQELLDKKRKLEEKQKATLNEDEFGEISILKEEIEHSENTIKDLQEQLKALE